MKKEDFIQVSKNMVKEYIDRYVKNDRSTKIEDIEMIDFQEGSDGFKILLVTEDSGDKFYGVTYDRLRDELHSYIYREDEIRVIGRREFMYEE